MARDLTQLSHDDLTGFLMQVGHALNLVAELPEWLEHGDLPKALGHAAAESFLMNCRMLTEFLWRPGSKDVGLRNYRHEGRLTVKEPDKTATLAAKQVAHPTRKRIEEPLVGMTYSERCEVRDQLLDAGEQFAQLLIDDTQRQLMADYVTHARSLASWPPQDGAAGAAPASTGEQPQAAQG